MGVENLHDVATSGFKSPDVADLAAGFSIKGRFRRDDFNFFSFTNRVGAGCTIDKRGESLGFPFDDVISDEAGTEIRQIRAEVYRTLLMLARPGALLRHGVIAA